MLSDVLGYLVPPANAFWKWADAGEVVAWRDGKTIAFRGELVAVLSRLAPHGLPPFGAVLLLLAATRDQWSESTSEPGILSGALSGNEESPYAQDVLARVLGGLDQIGWLDAELRSTSAARESLGELVFEGDKDRTSVETAFQIVDLLECGLDEAILARAGRSPIHGARRLLRELRCLGRGLHRVRPEIVRSRLRIGLESLPESAPIELPAADRVRVLIDSLASDKHHRGLAMLTRDLMAAVTLPRSVADQDDLPIGGVSDIINRGSLDRLLPSELVHDDLTLAVRIAVNEALYLRRESPPRTPPRQRTLLLETGIRCWGVPRVFSTAVALAMLATAERSIDVVAYCADGDEVRPVDLTTREGLESHLETLSVDVHPGRAIEALDAELDDPNQCERILVTTEDVLADLEFCEHLDKNKSNNWLLATVNRDGRFRLLERTARGTKQLCQATLDLGALFRKSTDTTTSDVVRTLVDHDWPADLPAICAITPFPLRLSHNPEPNRMWQVDDDGLLALTHDRRLTLWDRPMLGALQLSDRIPSGPLRWSSPQVVEGVSSAVVGNMEPDGLHLLRANLDTQDCQVIRLLVNRGAKAVCSHRGTLFVIFKNSVQVLDQETGDVTHTLALPSRLVHQQGRYFRTLAENRWYALAYDGMNAIVEDVFIADAIRCPRLISMFDRVGTEGPLGVTAKGDIFVTATGKLQTVRHLPADDVHDVMVSPDGKRLLLQFANRRPNAPQRGAIVDTETLEANACSGNPQYWYTNCSNLVRATNIRHRFESIAIDGQYNLVLSRRHQGVGIEYDDGLDRVLVRYSRHGLFRTCETFAPESVPKGVGYRLSSATWSDGSKAFVDTRGLLHLKSADTSIPEVTLVLADGESAGWCADGRLWGNPYHTGQSQRNSVRDVFEGAIRGFAERLRPRS